MVERGDTANRLSPSIIPRSLAKHAPPALSAGERERQCVMGDDRPKSSLRAALVAESLAHATVGAMRYQCGNAQSPAPNHSGFVRWQPHAERPGDKPVRRATRSASG